MLGNGKPFRRLFEISPTARRILLVRDIGDITVIRKYPEAVRESIGFVHRPGDRDAGEFGQTGRGRCGAAVRLIMRVVNDVAKSASEFNILQPSSLPNGTGNILERTGNF